MRAKPSLTNPLKMMCYSGARRVPILCGLNNIMAYTAPLPLVGLLKGLAASILSFEPVTHRLRQECLLCNDSSFLVVAPHKPPM